MSTNRQTGRPRGSPRVLLVVAAVLAATLAPAASTGALAASSADVRSVGALPGGSGSVGALSGGSGVLAAARQWQPGGPPGGGSVLGEAGQLQPVPPAAPGGAVAAPRVLARAAILADEATGQVLFERHAGLPRAMASTTKVMTALLALERLDERRMVTIGAGPPRVGEESLRLRRGERLTVRQLLLGLMVKSANDAAVALAEAVDGSEAAFVRRMNRKAAALRLAATHYVTPYGLDRPGHQTSARDLARLWEAAMGRADFRALVATKAARLPGGPLSLRRFVTSNQLLGSYRWTVGGKTGFTNRAGRCLVASASRGGRRLVAVALGSPNAFADVQALFEHGFSKFVRVRLAGRGQPVSAAAGRPAALQVDADTDALVRLDQFDRLRLSVGTAPTGSGAPTSAWFLSGQRRLVRVPLARLPTAGPPPNSTLVLPSSSTSPGTAPSASGGSPGTAGGSRVPPGATLTAGAVVRVWPVPPGAPAPAIDPFLRRDPS
jgi:D-alanyl-D-alanine carboxypeptidase (penicillin-binding protein 5/6)